MNINMKKINFAFLAVALAFLFVTFSVTSAALSGSWTAPPSTAPTPNADAPINVSKVSQTKSGSLIIGNSLQVNKYLYIRDFNAAKDAAPVTSLISRANSIQARGGGFAVGTYIEGEVGVTGATPLFARSDGNLVVKKTVGAAKYCDATGQNCFTAADIMALMKKTPVIVPPDNGGDDTPPAVINNPVVPTYMTVNWFSYEKDSVNLFLGIPFTGDSTNAHTLKCPDNKVVSEFKIGSGGGTRIGCSTLVDGKNREVTVNSSNYYESEFAGIKPGFLGVPTVTNWVLDCPSGMAMIGFRAKWDKGYQILCGTINGGKGFGSNTTQMGGPSDAALACDGDQIAWGWGNSSPGWRLKCVPVKN